MNYGLQMDLRQDHRRRRLHQTTSHQHLPTRDYLFPHRQRKRKGSCPWANQNSVSPQTKWKDSSSSLLLEAIQMDSRVRVREPSYQI